MVRLLVAALGLLVRGRHVLPLAADGRIRVIQVRHSAHLLLFSSINVILGELLTLGNLLLDRLQVADNRLNPNINVSIGCIAFGVCEKGRSRGLEPEPAANVSELRQCQHSHIHLLIDIIWNILTTRYR